jgi:hypothetical protein
VRDDVSGLEERRETTLRTYRHPVYQSKRNQDLAITRPNDEGPIQLILFSKSIAHR